MILFINDGEESRVNYGVLVSRSYRLDRHKDFLLESNRHNKYRKTKYRWPCSLFYQEF